MTKEGKTGVTSLKSNFSISNKDYKKFIPVFSLQITHNPRSLGSQAKRWPVSLLTPGLSHLCTCVQEVSEVDVGPGLPLSSHLGLHEQEGGSQDRSCRPQEPEEAPRTSRQPHTTEPSGDGDSGSTVCPCHGRRKWPVNTTMPLHTLSAGHLLFQKRHTAW